MIKYISGQHINPEYQKVCDLYLPKEDNASIQEHFDAVNMFDGCFFE